METTMTIRINTEEKEKLKVIAQTLDLSVSQLVRRLIREYINTY